MRDGEEIIQTTVIFQGVRKGAAFEFDSMVLPITQLLNLDINTNKLNATYLHIINLLKVRNK